MPLSEKPIHHEPHVETTHRSRDENELQRQSFGASDTNAPLLGVPGAKEFDSSDKKQEYFDDKQQFRNVGEYSTGSSYNAPDQHFDATLPATVIVERETEPTRTIVEYQKEAPTLHGSSQGFTERSEYSYGSGGAGTIQYEDRNRGLERNYASSDRTAASYGSMEGVQNDRRALSPTESDRLDEQGKHFQNMMDQEVKDERAFEKGRSHVREEVLGTESRHHHHHHHHHHHRERSDDERGAPSSSSSLNDQPQTHSSAAAHNADDTQPKPVPTGAAQPPPFQKDAPAELTDKAPANPKDAFPESKNQPIKGDTGNANVMDSNPNSAGRRDTLPTDTHPNPNTTGGKDGTSGRADGGMDQPNQLPKDGSTGLKGTQDAALSKDRLPKEGADSGAKDSLSGAPPTGSRPPGSADRVLPPSSGAAPTTTLPKDKDTLPKTGGLPGDTKNAPPSATGAAPPLGSRPPGSADRVTPAPAGGLGGPTGTSTAPKGAPPGSTAPLPPAAPDSPGLEKHEDEEEKKGMRGKMHHMKEKMKETLHIGHHDKDDDEKDPNIKDNTAMGGPVTTTK